MLAREHMLSIRKRLQPSKMSPAAISLLVLSSFSTILAIRKKCDLPKNYQTNASIFLSRWERRKGPFSQTRHLIVFTSFFSWVRFSILKCRIDHSSMYKNKLINRVSGTFGQCGLAICPPLPCVSTPKSFLSEYSSLRGFCSTRIFFEAFSPQNTLHAGF